MARYLPFLLVLVILAAAGCETMQSGDEADAFTPADAIVESAKYRGRDVAWGGVLVATTNQKDRTTLEILTYPLVNGRPQLSRPSTGRVLASVPGFLEPSDYAPGRHVVVEGIFTGVRHGYSGGVSMTHAVLEARKAELRSAQGNAGWPSNLHIGIGFYTGF